MCYSCMVKVPAMILKNVLSTWPKSRFIDACQACVLFFDSDDVSRHHLVLIEPWDCSVQCRYSSTVQERTELYLGCVCRAGQCNI